MANKKKTILSDVPGPYDIQRAATKAGQPRRIGLAPRTARSSLPDSLGLDRPGLAAGLDYGSVYEDQTLYYTSCDYRVFGKLVSGDYPVVPLDPILMIQWTLIDELIPIYGYRNVHFSLASRGTRTVVGQFQIPYEVSARLRVQLYGLSAPGDEYEELEMAHTLETRPWREVRDRIKSQAGRSASGQKGGSVIEQPTNGNAGAGADAELSAAEEARSRVRQRGLDQWPFPEQFDLYIYVAHFELGEYTTRNRSYLLEAVHITQFDTQIDTSGQPVVENYQFMARNLRLASVEAARGLFRRDG